MMTVFSVSCLFFSAGTRYPMEGDPRGEQDQVDELRCVLKSMPPTCSKSFVAVEGIQWESWLL